MKQHAVKRGLDNPVHMSHSTGVTAVTIKKGSTHYEQGHQVAPSAGNTNVVNGRHQKVEVHMPKAYDTKATNTGYMNSDRTNFLK
jgi:hypothetical protein